MKRIMLLMALLVFIVGCGDSDTTTTVPVDDTVPSDGPGVGVGIGPDTLPSTTTTSTTLVPIIEDRFETQDDLSNYPEMFFNSGILDAIVVTGTGHSTVLEAAKETQAATDIVAGLSVGRIVPVGSTRLDNEVSDAEIMGNNIISLGSPCTNNVTAFLLGVSKENCEDALPEETMIKYYEANGKSYLLILGETPDQTKIGARVLKYYEKYDLSGSSVMIRGKLSLPIVV